MDVSTRTGCSICVRAASPSRSHSRALTAGGNKEPEAKIGSIPLADAEVLRALTTDAVLSGPASRTLELGPLSAVDGSQLDVVEYPVRFVSEDQP